MRPAKVPSEDGRGRAGTDPCGVDYFVLKDDCFGKINGRFGGDHLLSGHFFELICCFWLISFFLGVEGWVERSCRGPSRSPAPLAIFARICHNIRVPRKGCRRGGRLKGGTVVHPSSGASGAKALREADAGAVVA